MSKKEERAAKREAQKQENERRAAEAKTPRGRVKTAQGILIGLAGISLLHMIVVLFDVFGGIYFNVFVSDLAMWLTDYSYASLAIALPFLGLLALCSVLSKKKPIWLTIGTALYVADLLALVAYLVIWTMEGEHGITAYLVIDGLLHIVAMYFLVRGVAAAKKLKNEPDEPSELADISQDTDHASYL